MRKDIVKKSANMKQVYGFYWYCNKETLIMRI